MCLNIYMYGPLRLSFALLANYVPKCQMSSGPHGPIFYFLDYVTADLKKLGFQKKKKRIVV